MRLSIAALAALTLALAFTACSSGEVYPGYAEHLEEKQARDEADAQAREDEARADQLWQDAQAEPYSDADRPSWESADTPSWESDAAGGWTCSFQPSMNDDWHDDAVCSLNGDQAHRPYLREWDDFVTEAELMDSASEYAAELNAG